MPHEVSIGQHPDIVVLRYFGAIETDDIITDPAEIHLDEGKPKYLLADATEVNPSVPEGMWERVHQSIISHDKLVHIAICVDSSIFRLLLNAVIKVTRQGSRVTLHETYEQAEVHLLKLIEAGG